MSVVDPESYEPPIIKEWKAVERTDPDGYTPSWSDFLDSDEYMAVIGGKGWPADLEERLRPELDRAKQLIAEAGAEA